MSGTSEHEGRRPERPEGPERSEGPESVDAPDDPLLDEAERLLAARIAALPDVPAPQGWQAAVLAALPEDPPPSPKAARSVETSAGPNGTEATAAPSAPGRSGREGASGASTRAVSEQATPHPRRQVRRWAMGASAAAAAVAAALAVWRGGEERNQLELDQPKLTIRPAGGTRTSPGSGRVALGDTLRVEVRAPADALLRLYRNEKEVVLECPSAASQCLIHARGLAAELTLSAPGSYRAVALRPASQVPRSTGDLDDDLAACRCETTISLPVVAQ